MNLSENAKTALLRCGSWNQGTPVFVQGAVRQELLSYELIGRMGGLTRRGSIITERLKKAQEVSMFGM